MNDFIEKTYNLINFRYLILIFQKYSLTCPKGGQNASLYLEMSHKDPELSCDGMTPIVTTSTRN